MQVKYGLGYQTALQTLISPRAHQAVITRSGSVTVLFWGWKPCHFAHSFVIYCSINPEFY